MKIQHNQDLTAFNSYRLKCRCKTAYFPETEEDVVELYKNKTDYVLLGSGHNIILTEKYYDKDFIIFNGNFNSMEVELETGIIEAEAGISMFELSNLAANNCFSGLEVFFDIPSSLGGAVVMNAGASGEEIKDVLLKVRFLDLGDMTVKEYNKEHLNFEYRNSLFQNQKEKIVLKAWMQLKEDDKKNILEKMESTKNSRWAKQPRDFPSAGSVFKRPAGKFVGPMLDELQLKGFSIGDAQISVKHSGFIINKGNATGKDILSVIREVQNRVELKYGLLLEVEQRII